MKLVVVLMFFLTVAYGSNLPYFLIKQRTSGKCLWPYLTSSTTSDPVQFYPCEHTNEFRWQFVPEFEHWGFIRHVDSDAVMHPYGGDRNPDDGTRVVVHSARHWGALFALDAVNERVTHKSGKNIHPHNGNQNPWNGDYCTIHSGYHDATRFLFVSQNDFKTEVLVYGVPTMLGQWKIINSVIKPLALHKSILTVTVGKSETQSISTSFEYSWESSAGFSIEMFEGSAGQTFTFMMQSASSTTWYEEVTRTR